MERRTFWVLGSCWIVITMLFFFFVPYQAGMTYLPVPLDDSWIHFSFARSLAEHGVFGLNAAEFSNGSTSPLWVLLLAFFYKATHQMVPAALALGALLVFLTSLVIYRLTLLFTAERRLAFIAAVAVLLAGRFLWGGFSGMEVSLFSFLTAAGILSHEKALARHQISLASGLLFGLASLARPEGHLLFIFSLVDMLLRERRGLWSQRGRLFQYLGIYLLLNLPYTVFSYGLTGRPFCSSYYSKIAISWTVSSWKFLVGYFRTVFLDNPVLCAFFLVGLPQFFKKRSYLLPLWLLGFPLVAAFKAPILIHHVRYNMPLVPLYLCAGSIGLAAFPHKAFRPVYLVLIMAFSLFTALIWARRFALDGRSIRDQHVAAGLWLRDQAPEEGAVATNDIGAISYFSGRKVVDLCGIVNPEILNVMLAEITEEERSSLVYDYLARKNVRYMAIYRRWFPWFVEDERVKKVAEVRIENNTIAGSSTMEIFKVQ